MKLQEMRQKYPEYNDLSDEQLADSYHKKYYSDIPKEDFYSKIGFKKNKDISEDISDSFSSFPDYAKEVAKSLPSEVEGAYHMPLGRSLKNIGQSIENLVEFPINLGSHAADYLKEKDIPYVSKLAGYYPHIPKHDFFGLGEQQPGDVLFQSAIPGAAVTKLPGLVSRAIGAGTYASSQGANPLHAALLSGLLESTLKAPSAIKKGVEKIPEIVSKAKENISSIPNKVKKPYEKFRQPYEDLEENKSFQEKIKEGMINREHNFSQEQEKNINPYLNEQLQDLNQKSANNERQIQEHFPEVTEPQLLENTTAQFKKHGQDIIKESNKLYKDFGNGEYGTQKIKEPFDLQSIKNETNNLYGLGKTTKQTISGASEKVVTYMDAGGAPKTITYPPKNASTNDYITLMREFRDASNNIRKQAKEATAGEAGKLHATANRLKNLQEETTNKIKDTIGEEGWKEFENIQKHYANYRAPLNEQPAFRNPIFNNTVGTNPFKKLAQPKYAALRERLLNIPEFREQHIQFNTQGAKHPLRTGLEGMSAETRSLLSPEKNYALNLRDSLNRQREHFNQARTGLQKADKLLPVEREHIASYSPEIRTFVQRVLHEKSITNRMKQEAKKLGIEEDQLKDLVENRNKYLKIATTVGGIVGLDKIIKTVMKAF